jgi:hypothetical protein
MWQAEPLGDMFLQNVGLLSMDYMALYIPEDFSLFNTETLVKFNKTVRWSSSTVLCSYHHENLKSSMCFSGGFV